VQKRRDLKLIDNIPNYDVNQRHLRDVTVNIKTLSQESYARVETNGIYEFVASTFL
jgi:hypothetical protein